MTLNSADRLCLRATGAAQHSSLARRRRAHGEWCAADPGPGSEQGPGSAAHHSADASCCTAPGTRSRNGLPESDTRPLLQTRRLSARYGDFQALFDIDFEVAAGECVAIVGANGAGKSSFLCSIAGLLAVESDAVVLAGEEIGALPAWQVVARGATLVPEGRRLFTSLTVEENLLMGAYGGRTGDWDLEHVYRLFPRLGEYRKRDVPTLSGGEQQMVAIGRALMSNPKLLMCDELSLGLAPRVIGDIYEVLAELRRRGITMVIVEQNVEQALAFADRVYCFRSGRVSLCGRPGDLTSDDVARAYFGV